MPSFSVLQELCTRGDWAGRGNTRMFSFLRNLSNSILLSIFCLFDSHGQLGHGGLTSEEGPKAVEALGGMCMSCVAAGGWHSVCISGTFYIKILRVKCI